MDTWVYALEIPILYPSPVRPLAHESLIMNNVIVEVLAKDLSAQVGVFWPSLKVGEVAHAGH